MRGKGCKQCAIEDVNNTFSTSGFIKAAKNKKGLFYVLRCFNEKESFYKIGITTRNIKQRYDCKKAMPYNYEVIQEIYDIAEDIWNLEVKLKRKLTSKYTPQIFFDGCIKECFSNYNEITTNLNLLYDK